MTRLLVLITFVYIVGFTKAEAPPIVLALKGLDPVELSQGKELPGKEDLTATRGRFQYRFASKEAKAKFEKSPEAFSIQWGGACGRMGPLSGDGDPNRWLVHDHKIYVFASEACRSGFQRAPTRFLEPIEEVPSGTAAQQKRGAELLELAIKGFGGAEVVDGLKSLRLTFELAYPQKNKEDFVMKKELLFAFPGQYREQSSYTGWSGANVITPKGAYSTNKAQAWTLEADVQAALHKQFLREPLVLLKARHDKGYTAMAGRKEKVGEVEVELLEIGVHGATTTLAVDPKTGRVLQARFMGRGGSGMGSMAKTLSDFKNVSKLIYPHSTVSEFEGRAIATPKTKLTNIAVNEKIDAKEFAQPE